MQELTVKEAAAHLGISYSGLRAAIHRGQLTPHRQVYGVNLVTMDEVEKYRQNHLNQRGRKRKEKGE